MRQLFRSLVFLNLLQVMQLFAAVEDVPLGPRLHAMAGAGCALTGNPEQLFYNPGALTGPATWQLALYSARLYGMDDLGINSAYGTVKVRSVYVSGGGYFFGNKLYQERILCAGLAGNITSSASVGAVIRYASVDIERYGSAGAVLLDVGGIVSLGRYLHWGWAIRNANGAVLGQCREKLAQVMVTGLCARPVANCRLCLDVVKDVRYPMEFRSGVEYSPLSALDLRIGSALEPGRFTAGMGLHVGPLSIHYAYNAHEWLQPSHLLTLELSG